MSAYVLRRNKLGRTSVREIARFSRTGIEGFRNDARLPQRADFVFRWGCTSNVPNAAVIVNTAEAIHRVSNKKGFRIALNGVHPHWQTYHAGNRVPAGAFGFQLVVRPGVHHQGRNLHVVSNHAELETAIRRCGPDWYAAPKIDKVAEYRVFAVSGRCVCVAKKHPGNPGQVAWNVAQGGRFENVRWSDWPLKAVRIALEAFDLSQLDFGGVDVMVDREGNCYVLEINAAPSLTSPYRQECFAKAFDYITQHGKAAIPRQRERGGYIKFIHPAVLQHEVRADRAGGFETRARR